MQSTSIQWTDMTDSWNQHAVLHEYESFECVESWLYSLGIEPLPNVSTSFAAIAHGASGNNIVRKRLSSLGNWFYVVKCLVLIYMTHLSRKER